MVSPIKEIKKPCSVCGGKKIIKIWSEEKKDYLSFPCEECDENGEVTIFR